MRHSWKVYSQAILDLVCQPSSDCDRSRSCGAENHVLGENGSVAHLFQVPSPATSRACLIRRSTYIISCPVAADNQLQRGRLQLRQLRCLSVVCPCDGNRPNRYRGSSSGYGDLRSSESASSESRGRDESRAEHGWEIEVRARGRWSCAWCDRENCDRCLYLRLVYCCGCWWSCSLFALQCG
jgi:hypothetical protein